MRWAQDIVERPRIAWAALAELDHHAREQRAAARREIWAAVAPMRRPELTRVLADIVRATNQAGRSPAGVPQGREPRQALASRPITRSKRPRNRQQP